MGGEVSLKLPFILGYVDDDNIHISDNDGSGQKPNETKLIEQKSTNIDEDEDGNRNVTGATMTATETETVIAATNQNVTISSSSTTTEQHRTTNDTFDDIVAATNHDDASLAGTLKEKIQFTDDMGSQDIDSVEDNGKSLNLVTAQIHHQLSEQSNEEIAHETQLSIDSFNRKPE